MEALVKSIPVYYEEYGTGIPLLMLHGGPADHRQMVGDMEPLFQNRSGWRRIYPDLPGMGKTPAPEWLTNQDQVLEIVIEFMQTVAPNQRFVVAGLSYGGYLARGLVYRQGAVIDGVLLTAPPIETDPTKQQLPLRQVFDENPQFLAALAPEEKPYLHLFVVQSFEVLEWIRTYSIPGALAADFAFWNKLWEHVAFSFPVDQLTTPFPAPTLILTGRQDSNCGYQEAWSILENYPRATFAVLDRAGHFLFIEQQTLFRALTSEWLNRVEEYIAKSSSRSGWI